MNHKSLWLIDACPLHYSEAHPIPLLTSRACSVASYSCWQVLANIFLKLTDRSSPGAVNSGSACTHEGETLSIPMLAIVTGAWSPATAPFTGQLPHRDVSPPLHQPESCPSASNVNLQKITQADPSRSTIRGRAFHFNMRSQKQQVPQPCQYTSPVHFPRVVSPYNNRAFREAAAACLLACLIQLVAEVRIHGHKSGLLHRVLKHLGDSALHTRSRQSRQGEPVA